MSGWIVHRGDVQGVAENSHVKFPSCESTLHNSPAEFLAGCNTSGDHARSGELVLLGSQPPWLLAAWETRENQVASESNGQGDDSVNDKEPAPASHATNAIISLESGI